MDSALSEEETNSLGCGILTVPCRRKYKRKINDTATKATQEELVRVMVGELVSHAFLRPYLI